MAEDGGSQSSGGEIGDRESRNQGSGFKAENEKSKAWGDWENKVQYMRRSEKTKSQKHEVI